MRLLRPLEQVGLIASLFVCALSFSSAMFPLAVMRRSLRPGIAVAIVLALVRVARAERTGSDAPRRWVGQSAGAPQDQVFLFGFALLYDPFK